MTMEEIKLLDHGYIKLVETWGSDARIVEAARMSTAKGFLGWGPTCPHAEPGTEHEHELRSAVFHPDPDVVKCSKCGTVTPKAGDEKLLGYLYANRHDTPFEMAGMIVEVRAPLFVFREWHRHRVPWSYNEASARYAPLPALDYLPTLERVMRGSALTVNKQAAKADGASALDSSDAEIWLKKLASWQGNGELLYQEGLRLGVPKELARGAMTVFRFSTMRASSNLRGWMHFLGLRSAPNAQEEIRVYAHAAARLLSAAFPRSMALFTGSVSQPGLTPPKASV